MVIGEMTSRQVWNKESYLAYKMHNYKPTKVWEEIHGSEARYKVIVAGRRSGKSTGALNHANYICMKKPGAQVWIVGPAYSQVRDIYWTSGLLERYLDNDGVAARNRSSLEVRYKNGSVMQFKGAENTKGLVGTGLAFLVCDEVSKWTYWREAWEQNLRPTLADKGGKVMFISTPQGYDHFHDLYQYAISGEDKDWRGWQIPTWESGAGEFWEGGQAEMDRFLEAEKTRMNEDLFNQEYGAQFTTFSDLVFKEFDIETHVVPFEVESQYPFENGIDFGGKSPTACLFCYFGKDDALYVVDEHYQGELSIQDHAGKLKAIEHKYPNMLKGYVGDSQGKQAIMDFGIHGIFITPFEKKNDSVKVGISRIREKLKVNPINKKPSLFIHPRCENLIKEFLKYRYKPIRTEWNTVAEEPIKRYDHALDALRYVILHHTKRQEKNVKILPGYRPNSLWTDI